MLAYLDEDEPEGFEADAFFHGWAWLSKADTLRLCRRACGREELNCWQGLYAGMSVVAWPGRRALICCGTNILGIGRFSPAQAHSVLASHTENFNIFNIIEDRSGRGRLWGAT